MSGTSQMVTTRRIGLGALRRTGEAARAAGGPAGRLCAPGVEEEGARRQVLAKAVQGGKE